MSKQTKRKRKQWQGVDHRDPCSYCKTGAGETWDHIESRGRGKLRNRPNITRACYRCNQSKKNQVLIIWLAKRIRGVPRRFRNGPRPDQHPWIQSASEGLAQSQ